MTVHRLPLAGSGNEQPAAERLRAALYAAADALVDLLTEDDTGSQKPASGADRLLTAAEVAVRTGLCRDYVYRHASRWPFTRKLGRAVRFSEAGLDRWLATRRAP